MAKDGKRFVAVATMDGGADPCAEAGGPFFLPEIFVGRDARDRALGPTAHGTIAYSSGGEIRASEISVVEHACGHRFGEPGFRTVIDPLIAEFFGLVGNAAMAVPPALLKRDGWVLEGDLTIARIVYRLSFEFERRARAFTPIIACRSPFGREDDDDESNIEETVDFLERQIRFFLLPGFHV